MTPELGIAFHADSTITSLLLAITFITFHVMIALAYEWV